ncbi:MAG: FAD-binding domain-containing protein, partial [Bacteroidia bacterium]|nr:FAD-binding domain-containing protein [Bacteroidia bacterium]
PVSIIDANTGIEAIDKAIEELYQTGYMHNHVRMYTAAIACNNSQSHWKIPAQWMYYHLIDGDWASNALSWQWVAGSNANKKYYANQENINKYCYTRQQSTFLDVPYSAFNQMSIPEVLQETSTPEFKTTLPTTSNPTIDASVPTLIYNYYNLDPNWRSSEKANRILLMEPSKFQQYPISKNAMDFMLNLANDNIEDIQIYAGEFQELQKNFDIQDIIYKEHPLNYNYSGKEDPRDWMFSVKGYYRSFFAFWKKCKMELK